MNTSIVKNTLNFFKANKDIDVNFDFWFIYNYKLDMYDYLKTFQALGEQNIQFLFKPENIIACLVGWMCYLHPLEVEIAETRVLYGKFIEDKLCIPFTSIDVLTRFELWPDEFMKLGELEGSIYLLETALKENSFSFLY